MCKIDDFGGVPILGKKHQRMTATINGIPLFEALITDFETGMYCISLVDAPAVESDFLAFDSNKRVPLYCVANEDKHIVRGVVMRANFPIYRYSEDMSEYYITFSADTIRIMAEKYLAEYRQNDVNLHHIAGSYVDGVHLVQYFIKDSAKGIAPLGFESIEDGSLFAEFQIHNPELWAEIKAGTFKGFSLEGAFVLERVQEDTPKSTNNMSEKMKKFKEALAKLVGEAFAQVTTDKGVLRWETDEDLKAGDSVFFINEDGEPTTPADGDYKTEDGKVIRVADGKVVEIVDDRAEVSEEDKKNEKAEELATIEERVARIEEAVARTEERIAEIEKRLADRPKEEAMSKIENEVKELREKLAKATPKGIAQNFEEQTTETKPNYIAELAKLRDAEVK